jgi:hypothetical protein
MYMKINAIFALFSELQDILSHQLNSHDVEFDEYFQLKYEKDE